MSQRGARSRAHVVGRRCMESLPMGAADNAGVAVPCTMMRYLGTTDQGMGLSGASRRANGRRLRVRLKAGEYPLDCKFTQ